MFLTFPFGGIILSLTNTTEGTKDHEQSSPSLSITLMRIKKASVVMPMSLEEDELINFHVSGHKLRSERLGFLLYCSGGLYCE